MEGGTAPEGPRELPLFPLKTVLFPGARLPLHIFERRYREMIAHCLETADREFVVLLIQEGDEVVEPQQPDQRPGTIATPHGVGTVARIIHADHLPDGRYALLCAGRQRIALRRVVRQEPYLIGAVEALSDVPEADAARVQDLAAQVRAAAARLIGEAETMLPEADVQRRNWMREAAQTLPAEPAQLAFLVPRTLFTATPGELQHLLATRSLQERLKAEASLLFREQQILQQLRRDGATQKGDQSQPRFRPPSLN